MPRNSSGTYSLYTPGNPVVPSTVITTTWANNTLSDIATALTDSLSRSGDGGMTAPLELASGAIGTPGLSWTAESTSGLYRAGAGDFRYAIGGSDVVGIVSGAVRFAAGAVGTPSASFLGDTDTGLYSVSANILGLAAGGGLRLDVGTTFNRSYVAMQNADGAVGAPSVSFINEPASGWYRVGAGDVGFALGGARVLRVAAAGFSNEAGQIFTTNGTNLLPSYSFTSDPNSGVYSVAGDLVGIAVGGLLRFDVGTTFNRSYMPMLVSDGAASAPSMSFINDADTGLYRVSSNELSVAVGGGRAALFYSAGLLLDARLYTADGSTGAPAWTFTADTDTGISRLGTDQLGFSEGGTGYRIGFRAVPRSTTTTTLVANDLGRCVAVSAAIAIPASVFSAGDVISIYNDSASSVNITIAAGTLRLAGTTSTGTRALAARGLATLWFNVGGATPEVIASGSGLS